MVVGQRERGQMIKTNSTYRSSGDFAEDTLVVTHLDEQSSQSKWDVSERTVIL